MALMYEAAWRVNSIYTHKASDIAGWFKTKTISEAINQILCLQWKNSPEFEYAIISSENGHEELVVSWRSFDEMMKIKYQEARDWYVDNKTNTFVPNLNHGFSISNTNHIINPHIISPKPETKMPNSNAARTPYLVTVIKHEEPKVDQTGNDITPDSMLLLHKAIIAKDSSHAERLALMEVAVGLNVKNIEIRVSPL